MPSSSTATRPHRADRTRTRRREQTVPAYAPQLASLVASAPETDEWLHEVKFDGFRMGISVSDGSARLLTRNGLDWSERFPEIVTAALELDVATALIDGEVALRLADGRTSFQGLQNSARQTGTLTYFAFDLLWLDGEDLSPLPLDARKARLQALLPSDDGSPLRYSTHVVGHGPRVHKEACDAQLEGIISKRRDAPATPGRSRTWVKVKCIGRQEFVIGGFTDPQGSRQGLGALLIGYHDGGRLVWAGKVGTGFSASAARDLRAQLEPLVQDAAPFSPAPRGADARGAHWVRPELVAEVAFTEWTSGGKIRHPSFQGLRGDKAARDVVREAAPVGNAPAGETRRGGSHMARSQAAASEAPASTKGKRRTGSGTAAGGAAKPSPIAVRGVSISNPQRVMYPDAGVTKLDLVRYVDTVGEWMLPHVAERPLTLVFCPDGLAGDCTYLKHGKTWGPQTLRRVNIREKTKVGEYMVADSIEGLVSMMQMNWIEVHTWNSTVDALERPNRLVFDLDPGPDVRWPQVVAAAQETREALSDLGLQSWVKTTGGRGLHVVVPLEAIASWADGLRFAERLAGSLVERAPRRYTTNFSKAGREDLILVDVMRNNRAQTAVSAYSPRARAGAPVSTPLDWDELSARRRPDRFTVKTVPKRLATLGADPWAGYWSCAQRLPER